MDTTMTAGAPVHHHAHHFQTADQEFQASKLGIWLFLVTEVLLFGGLFMAYTVVRTFHPEMFTEAHHHLSIPMGATNTLVLIFSSLTMALSIRAAQLNNRKQTVLFLAITLACAGMFLVIKYFEYSAKFHHGLLPGKYFTAASEFSAPGAHLFFGIYFLMTGLHGLHVIFGMVAIIWVLVRANRGEFGPNYYTPVECVGLYWHLVDLIWIFLFPLLYLVG